jgi:hypothetical protein
MRTNFVRTSLRTFVRTLPGWFALYCEPEAANLNANLARCAGRYELEFVPAAFVPPFVLSHLIVFAGAGGATGAGTLKPPSLLALRIQKGGPSLVSVLGPLGPLPFDSWCWPVGGS